MDWIGDPSVNDIITINQNELDAIGCGSLLGTDADADISPKAHIVKWTKDETLCLLALYKENQALFADPKKKKRQFGMKFQEGCQVVVLISVLQSVKLNLRI